MSTFILIMPVSTWVSPLPHYHVSLIEGWTFIHDSPVLFGRLGARYTECPLTKHYIDPARPRFLCWAGGCSISVSFAFEHFVESPFSYQCGLCRVLPRLDEAIRLSDHPTAMYMIARFSSTALGCYWDLSVSPNRRRIRDGQHELCELTFAELKILNGVQMVRHCIPQYRA